jgi:hypothetical protein
LRNGIGNDSGRKVGFTTNGFHGPAVASFEDRLKPGLRTAHGWGIPTFGVPSSGRLGPKCEFALSLDILGSFCYVHNESTNFWQAVDQTNAELAPDDLYVSHFFTEDQVTLLPDWRTHRILRSSVQLPARS